MARIAVDLDGVLCEITRPCSKAKPIEDNIVAVNKLYSEGHRIVIFTARYEKDRKITIKWLKDNKVRYHKLVMGKVNADYYIDDKMVTMKEICQKLLK